jgi:hypothetical protein
MWPVLDGMAPKYYLLLCDPLLGADSARIGLESLPVEFPGFAGQEAGKGLAALIENHAVRFPPGSLGRPSRTREESRQGAKPLLPMQFLG